MAAVAARTLTEANRVLGTAAELPRLRSRDLGAEGRPRGGRGCRYARSRVRADDPVCDDLRRSLGRLAVDRERSAAGVDAVPRQSRRAMADPVPATGLRGARGLLAAGA